MSEKILGLELSNSGLAAVVINKSFKKSVITDACWIPFPVKHDQLELAAQDGISVQDSIVVQDGIAFKNNKLDQEIEQNIEQKLIDKWQWDLQSFDQAVSLILSKLDLKGCSTSAVCVPSSFISFRTLNMPFSSESKIRQILTFEITSHLPMGNAGYISDFSLINRDIRGLTSIPALTQTDAMLSTGALSKNRDNTHIFTASIPSDIMDMCFTVLKKHGLQPQVVTSQGLIAPSFIHQRRRFLEQKKIADIGFENSSHADAFVEITPYNTVISVMIKGSIAAVRTLNQKNYLNQHDNQESFLKYNLNIEKTLYQTISGLAHKYDISIRPSIFYIASGKIDFTNFDIYPLNIREYIDIESSVFMSDEVQWFNAAAAALCSVNQIKIINFCQGEFAKSSFFNKFKHNLLVLSIFASFALICLFINIQYDTIILKKEVEALDKAIKDRFLQTFPDVKTVVEPFMQMQVELKEAEKQIGFALGKSGLPLNSNIKAADILYEISSRIPQSLDIEVTRFLISGGKVVMAGTTDNFNSVDQIKSMIEKYDRFKSVTINSAAADKTGNRVLFNFIIEVM
ncbi:MAG: hypothetical protein AB7U45_02060 [Desulfamplus sp.]